jgi:hypothetical protein
MNFSLDTKKINYKPSVVVAVAGHSYTPNFVFSWSKFTVSVANTQKINMTYTNAYSPNIYHCRNILLGGNNLGGTYQPPWGGKFNYDYIMFIDTDQVFEPEDAYRLIDTMEANPKIDVLAGMYVMADNTLSTVILDWDEEFFSEHGRFDFKTPRQMQELGKASPNGLVKAFYGGLGFSIFRKGVFDKLEYPWFEPITHKVGRGTDLMGEDVSLFWKLNQKGVDFWVDPFIYVGHEKHQILKPPALV